MCELRFTQACTDCPFRRASLPGWTGAAAPEWFVESALADHTAYGEAPCHQTVDYTNPDWRETLPEAAVCAGALIFARNNGKLPRDPRRAKLVRQVDADPDTVFATRKEFVEHHRRHDGVRSWEHDVPPTRDKAA